MSKITKVTGDANSENTIVRAITLPLDHIVGNAPDGAPWTWQSFNKSMITAWRLSTDLSNWCVRQLFVLDDPASAKTPDVIRSWNCYQSPLSCTRCGKTTAKAIKRKSGLPPAPRCKCKGAVTTLHPDAYRWDGAMGHFGLITRAVKRKYIEQRFAVIVQGNSSLLTYRFPQPYRIPGAGAVLGYADGGFPVVKVSVPEVGQVELRLRRRAEFGRQLAMFLQIHDGIAKRGEVSISRNRKGNLLVKLVGHFPRQQRSGDPVHACLVRSDSAALLVVEIDGRQPWVLNCDHLKRWQAGHRAYLQRSSEDLKREKRIDANQRRNLNKSREARCAKHNDRMDTAIHQITAQIVQYCERSKVGCVIYDDTNKEFIPDGFPWYRIEERLTYKLDGMGVALVSSKNLEPKERDEWLTNRSLALALVLAGNRLIAGARRKTPHPAVTPNPKKVNSSERL